MDTVDTVDTADIVHTVATLDNFKSVNSVDNVSSVNSVHNVHNAKDQESRTKDQGPRTKDQGPRIKDQGPRIKDHGPCFCTNEPPRRDTDVILRLSKFTIEDLPFYIGFISLCRVKMVVYDETVTLLWMLDLVLARMSILEEIRT